MGAEGGVVGGRCTPADVLALERCFILGHCFIPPGIWHDRLLERHLWGLVGHAVIGKVSLQTLKSHQNHRDVIQSLLVESQFHDILDSKPTKLMDVLELSLISAEGIPHHLDNIASRHLIKNAVT